MKSPAPHRGTTLSLFLQMGRSMRARMQEASPLPLAQCDILSFVAERKAPAMHDMAAHFNITAPSATSLVEGLVCGGYLKRVRDQADRRSVHVTLTARGARAAAAVAQNRKKVLGGIIAGLSQSDRRHLDRILGNIVNNLSAR